MKPLFEPSPLPPGSDLIELCQQLAQCGWAEQADPRLGERAHIQTYQGGQTVSIRRWINPSGQALAVFAMEAIALPSDQELFERFLNLSLEIRMVLTLARHAGGTEWALILTQGRVDLYRMPEESRLAAAFGREEWEGELLPLLTALARGKEGSPGGQSRKLPEAESLGQWLRHWASQVAAAAGLPVESLERALWQWILMLQVARRSGSSEADGGWGLACEQTAEGWRVSYEALSATEDMSRHLLHFEDYFSSRLFEMDRQDLTQRLEQIEETSLVDRLRAEMLMQSQDRFEPETVAWLFTSLDREQEGWRREVAGVEPVRRRLAHEGWTVYQPLVCDVGREGLTFALREADRLARYLNDVDQFLRQRRQADPGLPAGQPDLFRPNPRGIGATGLLDDGLNYLFAEALRLRGVAPANRLGVGITFLLKAMALSGDLQWPFLGIDTLDGLFLSESNPV